MNDDLSQDKSVARIMIVDDYPLVRYGLVQMFSAETRLEVCGEAGENDDALERIATLQPDLVIIGISLDFGRGLGLIKEIKNLDALMKILILSFHDGAQFAERVIRAGAMGYLNRKEEIKTVIKAVEHVLNDKIFLNPELAERVLHDLIGHENGFEADPLAILTDREREVFDLIGQGAGTTPISKQLHLSPKTIETHRENIKRKLKLKSGCELNRTAIQWNMEQDLSLPNTESVQEP